MQLEIKGTSRQLVWGTGAYEDMCDRLDISLQDIDVMMIIDQNKALNQLTFSALKNGAEIHDDSLDFNYKYFLSWLDQQPQESGDQIMEDYLNSKYLGKTMKERFEEMAARLDASETETVKKPTKKKSTPLAKSSATPINGD